MQFQEKLINELGLCISLVVQNKNFVRLKFNLNKFAFHINFIKHCSRVAFK